MSGRPITDPPRGILRTPPDGAFALRRWEPSAALAPSPSWFWGVEWDLRGQAPHEQTTLPHPSAHPVYEGDGRVWLCGPPHLVRDFTQTIGVPPARYAAGASGP
jgi:hypothetical protein